MFGRTVSLSCYPFAFDYICVSHVGKYEQHVHSCQYTNICNTSSNGYVSCYSVRPYVTGFLLEIFGSVVGWVGLPSMQSALYIQTCALEPISCEVDFVLKLLCVTYSQVPWQGNQL